MEKSDLKKNVVLRRDYERYTVHLPWKMILRHGSRKYIFSELQKLHPCFMDDCSFDSKVRIGKTGVNSDVVVMNKLKLAEYKNRGKNLFIEENKGKRVFSEFERNASKVFFVLLIILLAAGFLIFVDVWKVSGNVIEPVTEVKSEITRLKSGDIMKDFFSVVETNHGKVKSLEWKCNGVQESLTAAVSFLYPEMFENVKGNVKKSSVNYKEGKPEMTLQCDSQVLGNWADKTGERQKLIVAQNELRESDLQQRQMAAVHSSLAEFRSLILRFGAVLLEEKANCEIRFRMENCTVFKMEMFIEEICNFVLGKNAGIEKLGIKACENESFLIDMKFFANRGYECGVKMPLLKQKMQFMEILKSNSGVKREIEAVKKTENVSAKVGNSLGNEKQAGGKRKIGEIRNADGTKWIFFKNMEGKVIREKVI